MKKLDLVGVKMGGDMLDFYREKRILVTGGSEGIGFAFAELLAAQGAHLALLSRSEQKLAKALETILAHSRSAKVITVQCDITNEEATHEAVNKAITDLGGLDIVINCAGAAHPGYFTDLETEVFRQMMNLNYFGTLHVLKTVVPHFIEQRRGWILNTSSIAGFIGLFGYTGYCASKYAVVGFSQALRSELKPYGISVSVLCPPNTRTPGLNAENKIKPSEVLKVEESAKTVDPEDVALSALKQLQRGKAMIVPTFDGAMAYSLQRHVPWVIDQIVKRPLATGFSKKE